MQPSTASRPEIIAIEARRTGLSVRLAFFCGRVLCRPGREELKITANGDRAMNAYKTKNEIEEIVVGFESCQTEKGRFSHQSHVTVAVWYLYTSPFTEATEKMRTGLHRFLNHHGVGVEKYNETLTLFWLKMINNCLESFNSEQTLLEATNKVLVKLPDSRLANEYYSPERLCSTEAKMSWVAPDLKKLKP
jgi:hypothetical protein